MSRGVVAGLVLLAVGMAWVVGLALIVGINEFIERRALDSAPAGQNLMDNRARALTFDLSTRQPMPESLTHLQFLADAVRCPVSDRSAIMASCVAQRYHKMRDKALLWRDKYERLVALERAYWAALARSGLTQKIEHVNTR